MPLRQTLIFIFGKNFIENWKSNDSFFNFRKNISKNKKLNVCILEKKFTFLSSLIVLYVCLKIKNYFLKIFIKIRVNEKIYKNM